MDKFRGHVEVTFGAKTESKSGPLSERLRTPGGPLEPFWEALGCLGALLGGQVFQNYCKKH